MDTQQKWIDVFKDRKALWIHDDNPRRPHALLTSGKHSTGFFNSELVLEWPGLMDQACTDLTQILREQMISDGFGVGNQLKIGRVVGPAMGAITLAHDMARTFGTARKKPCRRAFVEKFDLPHREGEEKKKRMDFTRTALEPSEHVLLTEDVVTTGDSTLLAYNAVERGGGIVVPYLPVLVNRSGKTHVGNMLVVALIDHHMPTWEPDECPLCQQGSEALRPKADQNWQKLNAQY